jgi:lysophospholipase L1-like esterase
MEFLMEAIMVLPYRRMYPMTLHKFLSLTTAATLAAVAFAMLPCALAQQPTVAEPVPTGPVAEQIADSLLRQIIPAMQTQKGAVNAGWWGRHERDLAELAAAKAGGPVHLLFVGDSITDNYHKPGPAPNEVFKPTWDELFAPYNAVNIGVSGDSTQHVMWRLQHGEVDGIAPENIVLMIGTNNTWHDGKAAAGDVAEGVQAVVYELHARMPQAKVLVLGILPSTVSAEKSAKDAEINRMVSAAFAKTSWVETLDIGKLFLKADGSVDQSLFYDMLGPCKGPNCDPNAPPPPRRVVHPNTVGQRKMAEAVAKALYGPHAH